MNIPPEGGQWPPSHSSTQQLRKKPGTPSDRRNTTQYHGPIEMAPLADRVTHTQREAHDAGIRGKTTAAFRDGAEILLLRRFEEKGHYSAEDGEQLKRICDCCESQIHAGLADTLFSYPNYSFALYTLGSFYFVQDQFQEAKNCFDKLLALPDHQSFLSGEPLTEDFQKEANGPENLITVTKEYVLAKATLCEILVTDHQDPQHIEYRLLDSPIYDLVALASQSNNLKKELLMAVAAFAHDQKKNQRILDVLGYIKQPNNSPLADLFFVKNDASPLSARESNFYKHVLTAFLKQRHFSKSFAFYRDIPLNRIPQQDALKMTHVVGTLAFNRYWRGGPYLMTRYGTRHDDLVFDAYMIKGFDISRWGLRKSEFMRRLDTRIATLFTSIKNDENAHHFLLPHSLHTFASHFLISHETGRVDTEREFDTKTGDITDITDGTKRFSSLLNITNNYEDYTHHKSTLLDKTPHTREDVIRKFRLRFFEASCPHPLFLTHEMDIPLIIGAIAFFKAQQEKTSLLPWVNMRVTDRYSTFKTLINTHILNDKTRTEALLSHPFMDDAMVNYTITHLYDQANVATLFTATFQNDKVPNILHRSAKQLSDDGLYTASKERLCYLKDHETDLFKTEIKELWNTLFRAPEIYSKDKKEDDYFTLITWMVTYFPVPYDTLSFPGFPQRMWISGDKAEAIAMGKIWTTNEQKTRIPFTTHNPQSWIQVLRTADQLPSHVQNELVQNTTLLDQILHTVLASTDWAITKGVLERLLDPQILTQSSNYSTMITQHLCDQVPQLTNHTIRNQILNTYPRIFEKIALTILNNNDIVQAPKWLEKAEFPFWASLEIHTHVFMSMLLDPNPTKTPLMLFLVKRVPFYPKDGLFPLDNLMESIWNTDSTLRNELSTQIHDSRSLRFKSIYTAQSQTITVSDCLPEYSQHDFFAQLRESALEKPSSLKKDFVDALIFHYAPGPTPSPEGVSFLEKLLSFLNTDGEGGALFQDRFAEQIDRIKNKLINEGLSQEEYDSPNRWTLIVQRALDNPREQLWKIEQVCARQNIALAYTELLNKCREKGVQANDAKTMITLHEERVKLPQVLREISGLFQIQDNFQTLVESFDTQLDTLPGKKSAIWQHVLSQTNIHEKPAWISLCLHYYLNTPDNHEFLAEFIVEIEAQEAMFKTAISRYITQDFQRANTEAQKLIDGLNAHLSDNTSPATIIQKHSYIGLIRAIFPEDKTNWVSAVIPLGNVELIQMLLKDFPDYGRVDLGADHPIMTCCNVFIANPGQQTAFTEIFTLLQTNIVEKNSPTQDLTPMGLLIRGITTRLEELKQAATTNQSIEVIYKEIYEWRNQLDSFQAGASFDFKESPYKARQLDDNLVLRMIGDSFLGTHADNRLTPIPFIAIMGDFLTFFENTEELSRFEISLTTIAKIRSSFASYEEHRTALQALHNNALKIALSQIDTTDPQTKKVIFDTLITLPELFKKPTNSLAKNYHQQSVQRFWSHPFFRNKTSDNFDALVDDFGIQNSHIYGLQNSRLLSKAFYESSEFTRVHQTIYGQCIDRLDAKESGSWEVLPNGGWTDKTDNGQPISNESTLCIQRDTENQESIYRIIHLNSGEGITYHPGDETYDTVDHAEQAPKRFQKAKYTPILIKKFGEHEKAALRHFIGQIGILPCSRRRLDGPYQARDFYDVIWGSVQNDDSIPTLDTWRKTALRGATGQFQVIKNIMAYHFKLDQSGPHAHKRLMSLFFLWLGSEYTRQLSDTQKLSAKKDYIAYELTRKLANRCVKIYEQEKQEKEKHKKEEQSSTPMHFLIAQASRVGGQLEAIAKGMHRERTSQEIGFGNIVRSRIYTTVVNDAIDSTSQTSAPKQLMAARQQDYRSAIQQLSDLTSIETKDWCSGKKTTQSFAIIESVNTFWVGNYQHLLSEIGQIPASNTADRETLVKDLHRVMTIYYKHTLREAQNLGYTTAQKRNSESPLLFTQRVIASYAFLTTIDTCVRQIPAFSTVLAKNTYHMDYGNITDLKSLKQRLTLPNKAWRQLAENVFQHIQHHSKGKCLAVPFSTSWHLTNQEMGRNPHIVYFSGEATSKYPIIDFLESILTNDTVQKAAFEEKIGDNTNDWFRQGTLLQQPISVFQEWLSASIHAQIQAFSDLDLHHVRIPSLRLEGWISGGSRYIFSLPEFYFKSVPPIGYEHKVKSREIGDFFTRKHQAENTLLTEIHTDQDLSSYQHMAFVQSAATQQFFERLYCHLRDNTFNLENPDHYLYLMQLFSGFQDSTPFQDYLETNPELYRGFNHLLCDKFQPLREFPIRFKSVRILIELLSLFRSFETAENQIHWTEDINTMRGWLLAQAENPRIREKKLSLIVIESMLLSFQHQETLTSDSEQETSDFLKALTLIEKYQILGFPSLTHTENAATDSDVTVSETERLLDRIRYRMAPAITQRLRHKPDTLDGVLLSRGLAAPMQQSFKANPSPWQLDATQPPQSLDRWHKGPFSIDPISGQIYHNGHLFGGLPDTCLYHSLYRHYLGDARFQVLHNADTQSWDSQGYEQGEFSFRFETTPSIFQLTKQGQSYRYGGVIYFTLDTAQVRQQDIHVISNMMAVVLGKMPDNYTLYWNKGDHYMVQFDWEGQPYYIRTIAEETKTTDKAWTGFQIILWGKTAVEVPIYTKGHKHLFGDSESIQQSSFQDMPVQYRRGLIPNEPYFQITKNEETGSKTALPKWYIDTRYPGLITSPEKGHRREYWQQDDGRTLDILDTQTNQVVYRIDLQNNDIFRHGGSHTEDWRLCQVVQPALATQGQKTFTDFENSNHILFETMDHEETIHLVRHGLRFTKTTDKHQTEYVSLEFDGYRIAHNQSLPGWQDIPSVLKLEPIGTDTAANTLPYRILVPHIRFQKYGIQDKLENPKLVADFNHIFSPPTFVYTYNPTQKYFHTDSQPARLFMGYLFFITGSLAKSDAVGINGYEMAAQLLDQCYQNAPYTDEEARILGFIIAHKDAHRDAYAIRLRAHSLLLHAQELSDFHQTRPLKELYSETNHYCLNFKDRQSECCLRPEELFIIGQALTGPSQDTGNRDTPLFTFLATLPRELPTPLTLKLENTWQWDRIDTTLIGSFIGIYDAIRSRSIPKSTMTALLSTISKALDQRIHAEIASMREGSIEQLSPNLKQTAWLLRTLLLANQISGIPPLPPLDCDGRVAFVYTPGNRHHDHGFYDQIDAITTHMSTHIQHPYPLAFDSLCQSDYQQYLQFRAIDSRCKLRTNELQCIAKRAELIPQNKDIYELDRTLMATLNTLSKTIPTDMSLSRHDTLPVSHLWRWGEIDTTFSQTFVGLYESIRTRNIAKADMTLFLRHAALQVSSDNAKWLLRILLLANDRSDSSQLPPLSHLIEPATVLKKADTEMSTAWLLATLENKPDTTNSATTIQLETLKTTNTLTKKEVEKIVTDMQLTLSNPSDALSKIMAKRENYIKSVLFYQQLQTIATQLSNNSWETTIPNKRTLQTRQELLFDYMDEVKKRSPQPEDKIKASLQDIKTKILAALGQKKQNIDQSIEALWPQDFVVTETRPRTDMEELFPLEARTDHPIAQKFYTDLESSWDAYMSGSDPYYTLNDDVSKIKAKLESRLKKAIETAKLLSTWIEEQANKVPENLDGWGLSVSRMSGLETLTQRDMTQLLYQDTRLDERNPFLESIKPYMMEALVYFAKLETCAQHMQRCLQLLQNVGNASTVEQPLRYQKLGEALAQRRAFDISSDLTSIGERHTLLFEMDNDLLIRPKQYALIKLLSNTKQLLTQLNMGEGKSSVILLMAIIEYAKQNQLTRLLIPEQLLGEMKRLIESRVRPAFGMSVYLFPFHRRLYNPHNPERNKLTMSFLQKIYAQLKEAGEKKHVILMTPEQRLSFRLLIEEHIVDLFEKNMVGAEKKTQKERLQLMFQIEDSVQMDILDEADATFDFNTDINFTLGTKKAVDGGKIRYEIPLQMVLFFLDPQNKQTLETHFSYINGRIQLKTDRHYTHELRTQIATHLLDSYWETAFSEIAQSRKSKNTFLAFLTGPISMQTFCETLRKDYPRFTLNDSQKNILRTIRCWTNENSDVFRYVFSARHLVDYGNIDEKYSQDPNFKGFYRRTAFPFKGKDTPILHSNFSHPDVFICFSILSCFYAGLSKADIENCMAFINKSFYTKADRYAAWIRSLPAQKRDELPASLHQLGGVDLSDSQHIDWLYAAFQHHPDIIAFHIRHVILAYVDEYPYKLNADGFSIAITPNWVGTSGTLDNRYVLPEDVKKVTSTQLRRALPEMSSDMRDAVLSEISATDGKLLKKIGTSDLCDIRIFEYTDSAAMLNDIVRETLRRHHKKNAMVHALLDRGALITGMSNQSVAKYLITEFSKHTQLPFAGVVYFEDTSGIPMVALKREGRPPQCLELRNVSLSPNVLFVYFNDVKTRGVDMVLPMVSTGIITIGPQLKKDDFVQAVMRLRRFGEGQTITAWIPEDVSKKIKSGLGISDVSMIGPLSLFQWTVDNAIQELIEAAPFLVTKIAQATTKKDTFADTRTAIMQKTGINRDRGMGLRVTAALTLANGYDTIGRQHTKQQHHTQASADDQVQINQKSESQAQEHAQEKSLENKKAAGLDVYTESKWIKTNTILSPEWSPSTTDFVSFAAHLGLTSRTKAILEDIYFSPNYWKVVNGNIDTHQYRPIEAFLEVVVYRKNTPHGKPVKRFEIVILSGAEANEIKKILQTQQGRDSNKHMILHQFTDPNGITKKSPGQFNGSVGMSEDFKLRYVLLSLINGDSGVTEESIGTHFLDRGTSFEETFERYLQTTTTPLSDPDREKVRLFSEKMRSWRQKSSRYTGSPAERILERSVTS